MKKYIAIVAFGSLAAQLVFADNSAGFRAARSNDEKGSCCPMHHPCCFGEVFGQLEGGESIQTVKTSDTLQKNLELSNEALLVSSHRGCK